MGIGQYHISGSTTDPVTAVGSTTQALDAAGDKIGSVFICNDGTQDFTKIGVYCSALTGTSPVYRVVIQGYNATGGIPDGTDVGGGSPTAVTFSAVAGTYHELTLTNSFRPTVGTIYAAVLEYASGIIDGSNFATFNRDSHASATRAFPYAVADTAGSWAKVASVRPAIAVGYADGELVPAMEIIVSAATTNYGSDSTPDEHGNLWVPDDTVTIAGVRLVGRWPTAAANWDLKIYDSGDSVLKQVSIDGEAVGHVGGPKHSHIFFEPFSVTGGEIYRITMLPTTTSLVQLHKYAFVNAAHRLSFTGPLYATSRTNAGGWANDQTSLLGAHPILSDIAAGGGGGGLKLVGSGGLVG